MLMMSAAALSPLLLSLFLAFQAPDGFALLRSGKVPEAREVFQAQLRANDKDPDAWLGAGLVALRQDRLADARAFFSQALVLAPTYADAEVGLARCLLKEGKTTEAVALLEKLAKAHPERADIREELLTLTGLPPAAEQRLHVRPAEPQMPARAHDRRLEVATENGIWQPFYVKGMNLGAALPGRYPSEFPDRATYVGWIDEMAEMGINAIRVYTIHPPQFYDALRDHNRGAKHPIWLIHGVWAELPKRHDFQDPTWKAEWFNDMNDVIQVLHGEARLTRRPGRAGGLYTADVSPWTLAIILGREWESSSVVAFNRLHPGSEDWSGRFVTVKDGHAMERFLAESMDQFLSIEWDSFHAQRPIAFTNWPTLDPLHHITESTELEEVALQRKLGLPEGGLSDEPNDEDTVGLDMEKFDHTPLLQAGLFASYHAYPYYPDFLNLDPEYAKAKDHLGPSNYTGYLADLVRHHKKHPVFIAEFGVPSSRLVAHWQPQGMTHGGQNEQEQGEHDARLQQNIYDAGCAGGVLFAWIDEWFKKNWLTMPFEHPLDRKPLWYNEMDAEENYGLIAYRPGAKGPNILIDGKAQDWDKVPVYLKGQNHTLKVFADEGWLHLGIFLPGPIDWSKQALLVGLDTVDSKRGDHQLPWGTGLSSSAGLEFVALFQGPGHTGVFVDAPYALPEHRLNPNHRYRSVDGQEGQFVMGTARSNTERIGRDATIYPGHSTEIGWLQQGTQDRTDPAYEARAEWQVGRTADGHGFLEARLPWGLLNVTDPSARRVIDDPERKIPGPVGTALTPGFRLVFASLNANKPLWEGGATSTVQQTLPAAVQGRIPMPPLFTWPTWEQPTFHRFRKQSFGIYQKALADTPNEPKAIPIPAGTPAQAEAAAPKPVAPEPTAPQASASPDAERLMEQAQELQSDKKWAEAVSIYTQVLTTWPDHQQALFNRGQTLSWMKRFDDSIRDLKRHRQVYPELVATTEALLAKVCAWSKRFKEGIQILEPYVAKGDREATLDTATFLSWDTQLNQSITMADAWLKGHPTDREFLILRGRVQGWRGRHSLARASFQTVLTATPGDREALLGLAQLDLWAGDPEGAAARLEALAAEDAKSPEVELMRSQIDQRQGRLGQARARAEALKDNPDVKDDVQSRLRDITEAQGPWAEWSSTRTVSNDGLTTQASRLEGAAPLVNGILRAGGTFYRLDQSGQPEQQPKEWFVGLTEPIGTRLSASAQIGQVNDVGGSPASTNALSLGYHLGPGLNLSLYESFQPNLATPRAEQLRTFVRTYGLGGAWVFNQTQDHLNLSVEKSYLSAGAEKKGVMGEVGHRFPIEGGEWRVGLSSRLMNQDKSLNLGFFNPEKYRYYGALAGASLRKEERWEVTLDAWAGQQTVNEAPTQFSWGYTLAGTWTFSQAPLALFAAWTQSHAGLPVSDVSDPSSYQDHTVRLGLRIRGKRWIW
jgi:tetratricopeptide (TPR) repeat protein